MLGICNVLHGRWGVVGGLYRAHMMPDDDGLLTHTHLVLAGMRP